MLHFARRSVSAILRNWGVRHVHAHVLKRDPLPVGQAACRVRRYYGSLQGPFVFVETVLKHGRMFQGSDEV